MIGQATIGIMYKEKTMNKFNHINFGSFGTEPTEKNLKKAGVKTIDINSWGGYGSIVITYTYANKLWLGSGYVSRMKDEYNYKTEEDLVMVNDITGMSDEEMKIFNWAPFVDMSFEEKENYRGETLFPVKVA